MRSEPDGRQPARQPVTQAARNRQALLFQVMAAYANASTRRRASVNNTYAADSAERIDDPDGLLVREA